MKALTRRPGAPVAWTDGPGERHGNWRGARYAKDPHLLVVLSEDGQVELVHEDDIEWLEERG